MIPSEAFIQFTVLGLYNFIPLESGVKTGISDLKREDDAEKHFFFFFLILLSECLYHLLWIEYF